MAIATLPSWQAAVSGYPSLMVSSLTLPLELEFGPLFSTRDERSCESLATLTPACQKLCGEKSLPLEMLKMPVFHEQFPI